MYLYSSFFNKELEVKVKSGKIVGEDGIKLFDNPIDAYKMRVSQGNVPDRVYNSGIAVIEIDTNSVKVEIESCEDRISGIKGISRSEIEPSVCSIITYSGGRGNRLDSVQNIRRFR